MTNPEDEPKTQVKMNPRSNAFKVYQASAGSGKTYTIVKEYLECCLGDKGATNNYSHILAITFTNMAANEMKAKIIRQLNDIIQSDLNEEPKGMEADLLNDLGITPSELKENALLLFRNIIHDYSSFSVSTIDAFVQKLARSFAKDLNLPSQFNVSIDENEVADAITQRIGEQLGPDHPFLTMILLDFYKQNFENEQRKRIATSIHDYIIKFFSEETFQKNERNSFETEEQYRETLAFFQAKTEDFETGCHQFIKDFDAFMAKHQLIPEDFSYKTSGPCLGLLRDLRKKQYRPLGTRQLSLLQGEAKWHSTSFVKKAGASLKTIDEEFKSLFLPFLANYHKEVGTFAFYREQQRKLSMYVLRSIIKSEMESYIGEEMTVHISEFNKRINEVMGDFSVPFVYERLGEHFRHVFIDEFQDTSVLQWQNLLPLLDNTLANNSMSMVVGDGKQSIYRWRNGEIGQIVSLPRIYEKPVPSGAFDLYENNLIAHFDFQQLKSNYRSFQNIVDFNNRFFEFCVQNGYLSEEGRKVYEDQDPQFHKEVSVTQQNVIKEEGMVQVELFDPEQKDHNVMLQRIQQLIEELQDLGFSLKDITLLVRTNAIGNLIANYLNEVGIPVISAESILLRNSARVQLIINTLDYLIHTDNKAVIASVLYYWHVTHHQDFEGDLNGLFDKVGDLAEGRCSLEEVIGIKQQEISSLIYKSYSLFDLCSALVRIYGFNTLGDSHLNFLLDVVDKWQMTDAQGIKDFLEFWDKKKDKLSVLSSQSDAVSVMTIHKSKGLEFNVVIVPFAADDLERRRGSSIWIDPQKLGFEAIPHVEKVQFGINQESMKWSPQANTMGEEEISKVRLDNLNLSYVAFTRPRQRLHVLSYQLKDTAKSPLNAFLKAQSPDEIPLGEYQQQIYRFGNPQTRKVEEAESVPGKTTFFCDSHSCDWTEKISMDPDPSMFWISRDDKMKPQEWGEFVHQVLSEVRHAEDIEYTLSPYRDAGVIDKPTALMLADLFGRMVRDPLIREAFSQDAKIKNECEVFSPKYGICRPDRYAELPDKIFLLDYKTGMKSEEHHKQLQRYISSLKNMVDKKILAYLVYLGERVEVVPIEVNHHDTDHQLSINYTT